MPKIDTEAERERHIRNTLLGYLFRVFRAALNASL